MCVHVVAVQNQCRERPEDLAMDENTVAIIVSAISAAGAMLAALAAFRSAGTARASLDRSAALEQRRAVSEAVELAHRVATEYDRVSDLISKLGDEVSTYANLTGNRRSSWYEGKSKELADLREEQKPLRELAEDHLNKQRELRHLSEDELSDVSSELFRALGQLRVTKERIRDELSSTRQRNQIYLAERAGGPPS